MKNVGNVGGMDEKGGKIDEWKGKMYGEVDRYEGDVGRKWEYIRGIYEENESISAGYMKKVKVYQRNIYKKWEYIREIYKEVGSE